MLCPNCPKPFDLGWDYAAHLLTWLPEAVVLGAQA